MIKRLATILTAATFAILLAASGAVANPGPGESHQCAPGQHGGPEKPPACDKK